MSDNNLNNENEELENQEPETTDNDVVEEAAQDVEEEIAAKESVLGVNAEQAVDGVGEPAVQFAQAEQIVTEDMGKKSAAPIIIGIVAVLVVIAIAIGAYLFINRNPYNRMGYINVSGKTIGEVAESLGKDLDEFLAEFELPAKMPADTTEAAAYYTIPASKIAEINGLELDQLKTMLKLDDTVNEKTPWGEAEGNIKLADYIGGDDYVEEFKEFYSLQDTVTGETLWKDIRNQVDQYNLEQRLKSEEDNAEPTVDPMVSGDLVPAE